MLIYKYNARIVDVGTAFLYRMLDNEIFMEAPSGSGYGNNECVKLEKAIYGLVQAAQQYYKYFAESLIRMGFIHLKADPCLLTHKNEKGIVYVAVWVDDSLLIGDKQGIMDLIKEIEQTTMTFKVTDSLQNYLSCEINFDMNKTRVWIYQPHLI